MVRHCQAQQELAWLARVLVALVCTGLRISELASLRWSDVDWTANQIRLTDESRKARRHGNRPARQTKSGRSRSFPIHADLRAALEELTPAMDGLIFHGPHRGKLKPDTVRRALVRDVLAPLGPGFPTGPGETGFADGRLHSFRHFFCSRCAQSGVPEQVVKEWLGHRDSEMVRHYFHLHNEESQRQMRRLSFLGDVAGGGASPEV
jgi:integrase